MSRFASIAGNLRQIRSEYPRFHSIEQGGTTQILDLVWIGAPGTATRYELTDDEQFFSPGVPPSRRSWTLHQATRREPGDAPDVPPSILPGLTVYEVTTRLRNPAGILALRTTRLVLAYTDPEAAAGKDNAGQMVVAYYAGPDYEADPEDPEPPAPVVDGQVYRFQVSAATGSWASATNLLVVRDPHMPAMLRIFVARTINEEDAAAGTPGLERLLEL